MRYTELLGKTLREDPSEGETAGHKLLLKAGLIQQLAAGVYSLMPTALRSIRKIENIIRQEMDAAGGQEVLMPALQPVELWQQSGREAAMGPTLLHLKDQRDRVLVLGPTHEEVVTNLVHNVTYSYRDLPKLVYQIQTKFRDETRPRAGLIRVREFAMKDAYSFHADDDSLDQAYVRVAQAYRNIFKRAGLRTAVVDADSGAIGGKDSQEFIALADVGEDELVFCTKCDYAANLEKAVSKKPDHGKDAKELPLEEVATPGMKTIEEVSGFLNVPSHRTVKAVFYHADGEVVFVCIRGDLDVNEVKLKNFLKARELRLATDEEVKAAGLVAGYASPIGLSGVRTIADSSVQLGNNVVVGANKPDAHYCNANFPRDFNTDDMLDIAKAQAGHQCVRCGGALTIERGIEVGHIFKLGRVYTNAFHVTFLDKDGQEQVITMGCYGIGVGRMLGAAVEQSHDDRGIIFPPGIAPYDVHLVGLNLDTPTVKEAADALYAQLQQAGLDVLYDDRDETAGVKFNDADLLGMPVRITVSPRTLRDRSAEVKGRKEAREAARQVPLDQVTQTVLDLRKALA